MPGLCGIVAAGAAGARTVDSMVTRMRRYPWHVSHQFHGTGLALGHVAVHPAGGMAPSGLASTDGAVVGFDGELYSPLLRSPEQTPALAVADCLQRDGRGFLDSVHGCFSLAVWDHTSGCLSVAVDRYGMRPLYWTIAGKAFLFASEIDALLAIEDVSSEPDETGVAEFLSFGQNLGETTLYRAIRLVPAGSWLTFDPRSGAVTVATYLKGSSTLSPARSDADWKELIDQAAVAAVRIACSDGGSLGLSLSGGLDARTILGLAPDHARLTCVSLGIPGSIDHRAAATLAEVAGQKHHALMLAGDFLSRFPSLLAETTALTAGQYLDQGIVLTTLSTYRDLGIQTLLRGHAGELMHMSKAYAFSLDERALGLRSRSELVDWLWSHLTGYMIGAADAAFFSGGFGSRMRDLARASLEREVSRWDHVEPVPQRIWRLFVTERLRRETALSLQMIRNFVEVRVPFLEPALVDAVLEAPTHLKTGDELQTFMLRRHRPAFLGVVNANTGAPMGAGALTARVAGLRLKVLAKLGVAGYQPYERLGLWLARDLRPLVHDHLLSESAVARRLFAADALSHLVGQHESRSRNHTYLIMALLTLEMAERQLVKRVPAVAEASR